MPMVGEEARRSGRISRPIIVTDRAALRHAIDRTLRICIDGQLSRVSIQGAANPLLRAR
jgi:hypothetical protein